MVKRDPDDLISALNRNLKQKNAPTLKITLKRGGIWRQEFAKAHSRKAKQALKQQLKVESTADEEKEWPLLARYRENPKDEEGNQLRIRYNCITKPGRGGNFIESLMSVLRVNFFKMKGEEKKKEKKGPTKADPNSKASAKRKQRNQQNQERRKKKQELKREKRAEARQQAK